MKLCVVLLAVWLAAVPAAAQTTIYTDDFESGVTGWSNNSTDFDPDVTNFLGRFDNSPNSTTRTFTIPANTDYVEIGFDFYRFDSWDNTAQWGFDRFEIDVDGTQLFSLPFASSQPGRSGTTGNVDWAHTPLGPTTELAFGTGQFWFDQLHRVNLTVNAPGSTLTLTLRTDINQGGNDESGGFDNFLIEAFTTPPNIQVTKSAEIIDVVGNGGYATPGNQVEYTFAVTNTGGAVDADTLVLTDALPGNLTLFTGDLDGAGQPVDFSDLSAPASGLSCCVAAEIGFSDDTVGTPVFDYAPAVPFDSDVTHIQIRPSGPLRDGQTDPVNVEFRFRARID